MERNGRYARIGLHAVRYTMQMGWSRWKPSTRRRYLECYYTELLHELEHVEAAIGTYSDEDG